MMAIYSLQLELVLDVDKTLSSGLGLVESPRLDFPLKKLIKLGRRASMATLV